MRLLKSVLQSIGMVVGGIILIPFLIVGIIVWIILLVIVDPLTGGKISRWYEEKLFFGRNA